MVSPPPATTSTAGPAPIERMSPSPAAPDPDAPNEQPSLSYIPALDGLRASAVLGVMAYHGGIPWLPAGFLGVDAFFVLSGFLITSLLISEWRQRGRVRLAVFWARRARRLLPALLLLLAFVVLYAAFVTPAGTYPGLRLDALSTLFYVANWHFILSGTNYFSQTGLPSLLTHTWSLAVEEQFYLIWPLVVLGVFKFTGRLWVLLTVSVVGALASAVEMALLFHHGAGTTRLYYGTDTHGQCLLVGAAVAAGLALFADRRRTIVSRPRGSAPGGDPRWAVSSQWAHRLLSILGAAGAVAAGLLWWRFSYTGSFLWNGGFLVAALATAAVLVCVVCAQGSWVASIFSFAPLRYLGRVSYGLYLWHFPLFQWIDGERTGLGGYALFGARFGATLAVATVSFYVVERPIRQGEFLRQWRARVAAPAAVVAVTALVIAGTGSGTVAALPTAGSAPLGAGAPARTVLMLGDSTALTLAFGLSIDAARYGEKLVDKGILGCGVAEMHEIQRHGADDMAVPACNPSTPAGRQWPALWVRWIAQYSPSTVAILAGRWEVSTVKWRGRWTDILDAPFADYVRQQLQRAVDIASSDGAHVVLLTAPCYDSGEQSEGAPWPEDQSDRLDAYNDLVRQVAKANPQQATLVDLDGLICPGGHFESERDDVTVRAPDGIHFPFFSLRSPSASDPDTFAQTEEFGAWIGPRLWPSIDSAAGA
jgi:peptidoglycan/LPS O-acetylase OafA/YrhL